MHDTPRQSRDPADVPSAAGRRRRAWITPLGLAVVAAVLVLWRTSERSLFTAHEARAGRVARNMLRAEDWPEAKPSPWLVPQFSSKAPTRETYQKPPLYYWLVAGASAVRGEVTRLTIRLPSAAGFVLMVLATYALGACVASRRVGVLAALVLMSTPKLLWWGRAAVLDPLLVACITGSLLFFFRAHTGRGGRWQMYLFWGLAGLGTLVKATSLVVPLMAVALYLLVTMRTEGLWAPLKRLRPISGLLVLLAVAAPWHIAAHVATEGSFSRVYWGRHVFGRATGTGGFEGTEPWYYLPAMARDLFPWIVFVPGALVQVWRKPSRADRPRLLFPFVWFVGALVFFSAVSFRKDEYLFVAYPAAALLVGYFLDYYVRTQETDPSLRPWVGAAVWGVAGVTVVATAALAVFALSENLQQWLAADVLDNDTDRAVVRGLGEQLSARAWLVLVLAGPMIVGAVAAGILVARRRAVAAFLLIACTTILAYGAFVVLIVPTLNEVRGLASFAENVRALRQRFEATTGKPVRVVLAVPECHELAFELNVEETPPAEAASRLKDSSNPWVLVVDVEALEKDGWVHELKERYDVLTLLSYEAKMMWPPHAAPSRTPSGHRRPMVAGPMLPKETPKADEQETP
jgi:4-amino-4-deoxy-L-arabinose transferase-like glycosyltransferase